VTLAHISFLIGDTLKPVLDAVSAAVNDGHEQVRTMWADLLGGLGIQRGGDNE
jgi:hypothetical protein